MPSIITDDMVKKMCFTSRPIPVQAMGFLAPNRKVGSKHKFIKKRGRTGIKPVNLPTYAPASVGGLVHSICEITKLEPEFVENYLDNAISQELGEYTGRQEEVQFDARGMPMYADADTVYDEAFPFEMPPQVPSSEEPPIELFDVETQIRDGEDMSQAGVTDRIIKTGVFQSAGDVEVEYPKDTASVGEDSTRKRGRPSASSQITPRLRGSESRRADGEPEL
tara:strand:+ start:147 stop:812 length:666 start_codon:yes stop_codon:yes gene_type:complete